MVRIRHIRLSLIVAKECATEALETYMDGLFSTLPGQTAVGFAFLSRGESEIVHRAAQFANLFLMGKLHETSIGNFLRDHEDIIIAALNARAIVTEPYIEWQIPPRIQTRRR